MDKNISIDYSAYDTEEVEERLALGDPFVKKVFKKGKGLYG